MKNGQTLLIENDDPTTASRVQSSQEEIDDGLADLVVETTAAMASNIKIRICCHSSNSRMYTDLTYDTVA